MPALNIVLDGDNCWPDLRPGMPLHADDPAEEPRFREGDFVAVAPLADGMASGSPSVALRIHPAPTAEDPNPKPIIAQTSLALFLSAADAFKARFGDPRR